MSDNSLSPGFFYESMVQNDGFSSEGREREIQNVQTNHQMAFNKIIPINKSTHTRTKVFSGKVQFKAESITEHDCFKSST